MRTETIHFSLTLLFVAVFAGCAKDGNDQGIEKVNPTRSAELPFSASSPESKGEAWVEVPKHMQLPNLAMIEAASSWENRVARLTGADQAYLKTVDARFHGALEFQSEEEQRHLVAQGFPMPEEWLATRNLPDGELERMAKQGSPKAMMFYVDRINENLAPVLGVRGLGGSSSDRELFRKSIEAKNMLGELISNTKSPFAAYLYGQYLSATQGYGQGNPMEPIAAAFQLARDLGDPRADQLRNTFILQHPGMDAGRVMSDYSAMRVTAGL